jgi:chlorobactene glucosyltransferase
MIDLFIFFSLISFLIILINNIFYLEEEKEYIPLKQKPFISIIIPARNEEENIVDCLNGILNQKYENFELIVVDDNSNDKTPYLVEKFVDKNKNLKFLRLNFLPEGWMGKNFACWNGFNLSKGEYLLFTDADTRFIDENLIEYAISKMKEKDLKLLSLIPKIEAISFIEKIFMPLWSFAFITFLPLRILSKKNKFAFALGPFLLFERKFYEEIGGHKEIRNEIVDDIFLARKVKKNGGNIAILNGKEFIKVRFYKNYEEIKRGVTKSAFGAFNYSYKILFIFLLLSFIIFFLPFLNFLKGILTSCPNLIKISFLQISLIYLLKLISDIYNSHDLKYTIFFPISLLIGIYLCIYSAKEAFFRRGYVWKERFYPVFKK